MIALIRHSERLDASNEKKWRRSKRFKENIFDTPITKNGEKIAEKAINQLFNSGYDKIDYLYSSPLTRCIQTSLVIQKEIKKNLGKDIKIRIEYGLVEYEDPPFILRNGKFVIDSKSIYIDKELSIKNIISFFIS